MRKQQSNIFKMPFEIKQVKFLSLSRIFNDTSFIYFITKRSLDFEAPSVMHTLKKSIGTKSSIKEILLSLEENAFNRDNLISQCCCANSCLKTKEHGHILTGDLRITSNNKLRKLFTKIPNNRESISKNFKETKSDLLFSMKSCIVNCCNKHMGTRKSNLSDWKQTYLILVGEKLWNYSDMIPFQN